MVTCEAKRRRRHFFSEHAYEYTDSIRRVIPVTFELCANIENTSYMNTCPDVPSVTVFIERLKNEVSENEFNCFCYALVLNGEYSLFCSLLSHHVVEYERLEKLSLQFQHKRFKFTTDFALLQHISQDNCNATDSNIDLKQTVKQQMPNIQRAFLQKFKETMRLILSAKNETVENILDYLLWSRTLSYHQYVLVKAEPVEQRVYKFLDYLTQSGSPADAYQRLCHAFILTKQFKLFTILRDHVDPKRLENFRNEICQFLSENDGNKIIHEHYVGTEIEDETEVMYDVPPADGILENLSVDLPDVGSACQLDYYVANKQDIYRNFSKPKGLALIINNHRFRQDAPGQPLRNRDGTEVDKKNITNLLAQLGYHILPVLTDLTADDMFKAARKFANADHTRMDSCVVVVLTHGEYDHFLGVDGVSLNQHKFLSCFNASKAPTLAGKPKIFIFQACRGDCYDVGVIRSVPIDGADSILPFSKSQRKSTQLDHGIFSTNFFSRIGLKKTRPPTENEQRSPEVQRVEQASQSQVRGLRRISSGITNENTAPQSKFDPKQYKKVKEPTDADMLIAYATTPNYVSWRNSMNGTWFIQSICEIFSKYAAKDDIMSMLTRVKKQVADVYQSSGSGAKQIPETATRLRKKFYFFPGIDSD
ncbi:caspase domain-containing protein [Ditylenchus destructor]|uniref:Caspase domain-containing protein n=1 Tax=Ditylenchus destructor TaxID=166010 RepID=A0AAD4NF75_9BILA|nr:caspase domain-containing protein [Ditylenchus destructor]